MPKDQIFHEKRDLIQNFDFGEKTASVFDDMLDRSVPFYGEIQRMIGELCADFAVAGSNIYDLGCSTGNTFLAIQKQIPGDVRLIGVDSSEEMLAKARTKLEPSGLSGRYELRGGDLNEGFPVENASVVILNLTLQFVRPLNRSKVIRDIFNGTREGGCLILVEKVLTENSTLNRLFIKNYYEMKKRNGYSDLEIAQKREALENILIPYHYAENHSMLLSHGYAGCDVFFRWYNFCAMIAIK